MHRKCDRSPMAVAISPDGRFCLTANYTAGTVSLVDLAQGKVLTEERCGRGPCEVVWIDENRALVSLLHEDSLALLQIDGAEISTEAIIPVGDEPRGIVVRAPTQAFVAISQQDQVAVLDLKKRKVSRRIPVGHHPRGIALAPNQRWLITSCSTGGEVYVHDSETYALISRRSLLDETGNLGHFAVLPDSSACIIPHIVNRSFPVDAENIEKGWVIDNRLSMLPLPDGEAWDQTQLGLDTRGDAVGDAYEAAISPKGQWLVVTCGGSHELLIFRLSQIPWPPAEPGDFLPNELLREDDRFRRLELGGRPLGVRFIDATTAVIANYLLNSLQIVDVAKARLLRTIPLGGPEQPSLARRGEAIFYDADRSLNSWFSCHTCHLDGHTSGFTFDTLNDGSYNTPKLTPSLRGVAHSAPWTWHGWQNDLLAAMKKSLTSTMQTRQPPTDSDAEALVAFLSTLDYPRNPHRAADGSLSKIATKGKSLFEGKAGCATCHRGQHFTFQGTFDVGLGSPQDAYPEYNPPVLRGLYARRRFLHDGRARSLREVLREHHQPEAVAGEPLEDAELEAILAYLNSL